MKHLLSQLRPQQKLVFYVFVVVGLALIVLGFLFQPLGADRTGLDIGVLAFSTAVGLFWIAMAFIHAVIGAMRAAEKGQTIR